MNKRDESQGLERGRVIRYLHLAVSLAAAAVLSAGCRHTSLSGASRPAEVVEGTRHMVAADHPLASEAGASILARGGNAVDAAVATSLALCVTRPYSTGIGGGGFMMIKRPGDDPLILDYRETAPAACRPQAYIDANGDEVPGRGPRGPWTVGVPGLLRGLAQALDMYGTMSLAELAKPAIDLAERGFAVDAHTHSVLESLATHCSLNPNSPGARELARIYLDDGRPLQVGHTLSQPELARTLRTIADQGVDVFYTGELAGAMARAVRDLGGPMAAEDLAGYEVMTREPLYGAYRGYRVAAMPPPSAGGACLVQMLNVIEGFDIAQLDPVARYHVLAEAMKHAYADRSAYLGDADANPAVHADVAKMVSSEAAARIQGAIDLERTHQDPLHYGSAFAGGDAGTTHFCVVDESGMAVAATETINYPFGSYVVVPGTGIVLNNELDDFTISGSPTNSYGLAYSTRNSIGPGRRPLSSMSPTMLLQGDEVAIIAGASGGQRIITSTLQSILQITELGKAPGPAVAAPRVHHQWIPNRLQIDDGIPDDVRAALRARGHNIVSFRYHSGVCQLVYRSGGLWHGVSEPRKGGRPAGR